MTDPTPDAVTASSTAALAAALEAGEPRPCGPLRIDFDRLAAAVFDNKRTPLARRGGPRLRTVEHALLHLREETGLDDRQIAKVLMTMSVVLVDMLKTSTAWNATATANWLALCGEQLWREAPQPPGPAQDTTPDPGDPGEQPDGRYWAVWKPDGTLRLVVEYAEPRLGGEVLAQLTADGEIGPFELEPVTEARANQLRGQVEQVRR